MYTWVPTHKAIAQKLLAYEHRQQELITMLKNAGEKSLSDKDHDGQTIGLNEIDPFTFFCYIYKYGEEKRLEQLRKIAGFFDIKPLLEAASAYYNEIKDTRLKGLYKRFTNLAVIKSLFDVEFRESVITKAMAYGNLPAQKKLIEKYKALLRA